MTFQNITTRMVNESTMSDAGHSHEEVLSSGNSEDSLCAAAQKREQQQAQQEATAKVGSWSYLKLPEYIAPAGFDQEGNRMARQLTSALDLSLQSVEATLDEVAKDPHWR